MGIEGRHTSPQEAREVVDQVIVGAETNISSLVQGKDPERVEGRNLDLVGTHIPGFYLLVNNASEAPNMLRSEVNDLATDIRIYYLRDQVIKRLQVLQEPIHDRLVQGAMNIENLRGGRDLNLGGEVQLNPNTQIDPALLEESLGERTHEFVHQKTIFSVELDPESDDIQGIHKALRGILKRRGIDPDKITRNDTLRIDRDELLKAEKKGDIVLFPGTITVSLEPKDWKVKPRTVTTLPEVQEAIRRAAQSLGLNNPEKSDLIEK
jgi:hypothetical protein